MHQSLEKVEEDKDVDENSSQSSQEKEADPPDPTNASLPKDSSYLASEVARTSPNRTPPPYTTTAYNAGNDNGALSDNDADCLQTLHRLRQESEAEAFWAGDTCVTYTTTVTTETRNMDVTATCTGIVP